LPQSGRILNWYRRVRFEHNKNVTSGLWSQAFGPEAMG
jgi:hypothetical protein